ncbi:MAG: hypothetical protein ABR608_10060 [Pseudonocardiaceae bacterium]
MTRRRLYMARDLGRAGDVQRIAPAALASSTGMGRRHVLCTPTLAASYLPAEGNPHSDIDQACEVLGQVLPSLGSLHTQPGTRQRRALAAHADRPQRPGVRGSLPEHRPGGRYVTALGTGLVAGSTLAQLSGYDG